MASTVMTISRALTWWQHTPQNEKQRLAEKHYPKEVEALGLNYVHRSNEKIGVIYKKEVKS